MDTIKFAIEQYVEEEYGFGFPVINIYINGRNLIDLVSEIENHQRGRNDESSPRSSYIGFEVSRFERFRNEMLGKKRLQVSILLTCTCTIEMCNCIMAKIAFETQTVAWSELKSSLLGEQPPVLSWMKCRNWAFNRLTILNWVPLSLTGNNTFQR